MRNDKLNRVFGRGTVEQRVLIGLLERAVGPEGVEEVMEEVLPTGSAVLQNFKGRPLFSYSGMGREKLKSVFRNLDDDDVTAIFDLLGVQESAPADEESETPDEVETEVLAAGPKDAKPSPDAPKDERPAASGEPGAHDRAPTRAARSHDVAARGSRDEQVKADKSEGNK